MDGTPTSGAVRPSPSLDEAVRSALEQALAQDAKSRPETAAALRPLLDSGRSGGASGPQDDPEMMFLEHMTAFQERLGLSAFPYVIEDASDKGRHAQIQATYSLECEAPATGQPGLYVIHREHLDAPFLAEYTAFMGWFLHRYFAECQDHLNPQSWNAIRWMLSQFFIQTDPVLDNTKLPTVYYLGSQKLADTLDRMVALTGSAEPVRAVLLELVKVYNCRWSVEEFLAAFQERNNLRPKGERVLTLSRRRL